MLGRLPPGSCSRTERVSSGFNDTDKSPATLGDEAEDNVAYVSMADMFAHEMSEQGYIPDLSGKKSRKMAAQAAQQARQAGVDQQAVQEAAKAGDQERFKFAVAGWAKSMSFRRILTPTAEEVAAYFAQPATQEWAQKNWTVAAAGQQVPSPPAFSPAGGQQGFSPTQGMQMPTSAPQGVPTGGDGLKTIQGIILNVAGQGLVPPKETFSTSPSTPLSTPGRSDLEAEAAPKPKPPSGGLPSTIGGLPTTYVVLGAGVFGIIVLAVALKKKKAPEQGSYAQYGYGGYPQYGYPQQYGYQQPASPAVSSSPLVAAAPPATPPPATVPPVARNRPRRAR